METYRHMAANAAQTAEFYRKYALNYEPGSQGYAGNMAEAAKYAGWAERYNALADAELAAV